jgi:2-keto-4-pentenoate hydratase/2-oxohepta-3-ene-1,7-dioic acid hydratase in catechol pathway
MRLANVDGRAVVLTDYDTGIDVFEVSSGAFGPDLPGIYEQWPDFLRWSAEVVGRIALGELDPGARINRTQLGPPSPRPRQIFAIGRNYHVDRAAVGSAPPDTLPPAFTKFLSSLAGPDCVVDLPRGGTTDWEVELVVVIGSKAREIPENDGWGVVAGVCLGQDLSERAAQAAGPSPQFSLAKSHPNFAPTGPWIVTPDELDDRDDIALGCAIDGEVVQAGSTRELIFSVPALIARLSQTVTLMPGDLIFTGTPAGVGQSRTPPRFLAAGDKLRSWAEGVGELNQTFRAPADRIGA